MDILLCLDSLAERQLEIYTVGKAQPHDIGIVLLIFERGCPFRKLFPIPLVYLISACQRHGISPRRLPPFLAV